MINAFFAQPILNSPYEHPFRHWEPDHEQTGRIAVKVINHLGDEVMKVFKVGA